MKDPFPSLPISPLFLLVLYYHAGDKKSVGREALWLKIKLHWKNTVTVFLKWGWGQVTACDSEEVIPLSTLNSNFIYCSHTGQ